MKGVLSLLGVGAQLGRRGADELYAALVCVRAGALRPEPPHRTAATLVAVRRYGALGALTALAAQRHGGRIGLIDDRGPLSFAELDQRADAVAAEWRRRGLRAGDGVAILARNHRGFVDATFAALKSGARTILLNTDFGGPQIRDAVAAEGARLLVHDDEFGELLQGVDPPLGRMAGGSLDALAAAGASERPPGPERHGRLIVLTSGTTGRPKGADRPQPHSLVPLGALLGRVPLRGREVTAIAAPLFHSLGFAHAALALTLGSTMVLRSRFDAATLLDDLERHRASALIAVPVMLRRMLALDPHPRRVRDLRSLRIVFVGGSPLGAELARRALDGFGPVLYNLYGSTEVAYATIATPGDLAAAPATVGTPPRGATVALYDEEGRRIAQRGITGRIFVGNGFGFAGYTGGGGKEVRDGLIASGDIGHFDDEGRLFIDGRDDDMIVSGGENVFPGEVEELLHGHPRVAEAAVVAVEDAEWGHRLRAFVVPAAGPPIGPELLINYVRDHLARFKAPRDVVFVDELPRTSTGKVARNHLM